MPRLIFRRGMPRLIFRRGMPRLYAKQKQNENITVIYYIPPCRNPNLMHNQRYGNR